MVRYHQSPCHFRKEFPASETEDPLSNGHRNKSPATLEKRPKERSRSAEERNRSTHHHKEEEGGDKKQMMNPLFSGKAGAPQKRRRTPEEEEEEEISGREESSRRKVANEGKKMRPAESSSEVDTEALDERRKEMPKSAAAR